MLKYLRIAVTALCLTACVLLVALWVRSYWWIDIVDLPLSKSNYGSIVSVEGHVSWDIDDSSANFRLQTYLVEDYRESVEKANPWLKGVDFFKGFRFDSVQCHIPFWFVTLLAGVPAIALSLPTYRRFSLRALLIATTLVAILLGVIGFKLNEPSEHFPIIDVGDFDPF